MARKHKTVRNYSKKTKRKKYKKKNKTKHRVKKSITKYQDGGFPITGSIATGIGAVVAKRVADKFRKFSKEQMHKFMKWLLDSSMKALDETLTFVNYSSPAALKSMFQELKNALNIGNFMQLKRIYEKYKSEIEKLSDFNKLKPELLKTTYKNNLVRILKEDIKTKSSELKLNYKSFKSLVDELSTYINKSKTLFHTSPSLERQLLDQQRYTDPSLTPDKPTGTSKFGTVYHHESFL